MTETPDREEASRSNARRQLVIVSGAGRSGTSTIAGSLASLGYVVPPPVMKPNEANPRGYFEPIWAINFHKRILTRASVHTLDARPSAQELVQKVVSRGPFQNDLNDWLAGAFESESQLIVKDPRAFWVRDLWTEAAKTVGAEVSFLTMLRHPAEVIGSRDTHYDAKNSEEIRIARLIRNLSGWINSTLINEATSRHEKRVFLRYGDLLTDWRTALSTVNDTLGLGISQSHFDEGNHPIDEFIDPALYRVKVNWDDLELPDYMQDLAQTVWDLIGEQSSSGTITPDLFSDLDRLHAAYGRRFTDAVSLATDEMRTEVRRAKGATKREVTKEFDAKVQLLEGDLSTTQDELARTQEELGKAREALNRAKSKQKKVTAELAAARAAQATDASDGGRGQTNTHRGRQDTIDSAKLVARDVARYGRAGARKLVRRARAMRK